MSLEENIRKLLAEKNGERADLSGADLEDANLSGGQMLLVHCIVKPVKKIKYVD